jgi:cytidine deaminase
MSKNDNQTTPGAPAALPLKGAPPAARQSRLRGVRLAQARVALVAAAQAVRQHAHAPYSKFAVGAAVLDEQGRIHAGCNVENAAYPQGWCAEASALAVMVAAGGKRVLAAAVCAVADDPVPPCGGCRQKLREFAADDCPIFVAGLQGLRKTFTLGELLPFAFGPQYLARNT